MPSAGRTFAEEGPGEYGGVIHTLLRAFPSMTLPSMTSLIVGCSVCLASTLLTSYGLPTPLAFGLGQSNQQWTDT